MKKIKKILAAVMTLAMVLGMSMTTFAAPQEVTNISSTVTLTGLSSDVSTDVKVYQFARLFHDSENNSYSWQIAEWADELVTLSSDKTKYVVKDNNYKALENATVNAPAQDLVIDYTNENENAVEGTTVDLPLNIGGYVIVANDDNSVYGPLVVNTYDRDKSPSAEGKPVPVEKQVVVAKAESHEVTKKGDNFAQVGSEVDFTVTTTYPRWTNDAGQQLNKFIVTDTPTGLAIDEDSVVVKIGGTTVTPAVNVDDITGVLTVNFAPDYLQQNYAGLLVEITYSATVTKVEYNNSVAADSNTVDYGDPTIVTGKTGAITLTKKDAETKATLPGATFRVYDLGASTDTSNLGDPMEFIKDGDSYRPYIANVDTGEKVIDVPVDANGVLNIVGLDEGNYYFEETKAPNGYSINDQLAPAQVKDGVTEAVAVEFLDIKLADLPSTGGIGTTIFTIGGCIIMIAAAGLFFASRRKSSK